MKCKEGYAWVSLSPRTWAPGDPHVPALILALPVLQVLPGKCVEVEGVEMEPEERSMKGWSQVWRKISQEEKKAAAETRGWEEFKSSYPTTGDEASEERR